MQAIAAEHTPDWHVIVLEQTSVTAGGTTFAGFMVKLKVAFPVPPAFVALIPIAAVPAAVGVPEMIPVTPLMVSPVGRFEAPKLAGVLVAAIG